MKYYLLVLIFFFGVADARNKSLKIPLEYHGVWDATGVSCTHKFSDMRIVVGESSVEYWESVGQVINVEFRDKKIEIELAMSGEGEEWQRNIILQLIKEGDELIERLAEINPIKRHLCKSK